MVGTDLDVEAFKKEGFSYEEIESIIEWNRQVDNGEFYSEEEFYSRLEKRIFSNEKVHV